MLTLAETLEDLGYAYATPEGNVYYDVAPVRRLRTAVGQHAWPTCVPVIAATSSPTSDDPADFALWKAAGPGRLLKWPSERWGEGFPGWHVECSAMAMRYLGPRFDIHTGGIDNVFPHHEDEIAQSSPIVGGPPARTWVHGEFLLMDGRKMAKSAGNFQRVTELTERGIDPLAFRYLALTSRYSRKLEYSDRSIEAAAAALASLRAGLAGLGLPPADGPWVAPPVLRAGAAGDRPNGIARGVAGHGTRDAETFVVADRAGRTERPVVDRRTRVPRPVRGRHRRRPRHARRAGAHARGPARGPVRGRAALAHPRRRPRPGARPGPRLGGADASASQSGRDPRRSGGRSSRHATPRAARRTTRVRTRCVMNWPTSAGMSSTVRPAAD